MFSSRHNAFHRAHLRASHLRSPRPSRPPHPPQCHPERSEGSAFGRSLPTEGAPSFAHSLPSFSTATLLRTRSNTRNSNPFMTLLHDSLDTPGGGLVRAALPSFAPSGDEILLDFRFLTPILEQPPTAIPFKIRTYTKHTRIPFRFRTSKTQHLKSFRIRTYRKTGEGALRLGWISDLSTSRLSVAHSMLRPAL
jgi:hypothetical protein